MDSSIDLEPTGAPPAPGDRVRPSTLAATTEPFDSFWEGPADVEKGYYTFGQFYRHNYLRHLPAARTARILAVSCGPGYLVNLLRSAGYTEVFGVDSDAGKIAHAQRRGLPCARAEAFSFLQAREEQFDAIVCEQEINHLTKPEILAFLALCRRSLVPGGTLIVHSLNGGNPITGAEALAQNFDHFNTFTEYSLRQVLEHTGFREIRIFPLNLYVFYRNPLNYVLMTGSALFTAFFRLSFMLYGKSNRLFTKKIAAVCRNPGAAASGVTGA